MERTASAKSSVLTVVSVVLLALSFVAGVGSGDVVAGYPSSWGPTLLIVIGRGLCLLFTPLSRSDGRPVLPPVHGTHKSRLVSVTTTREISNMEPEPTTTGAGLCGQRAELARSNTARQRAPGTLQR